MSFLKAVGDFFKGLGESVLHALGYAATNGLTDVIVAEAKKYVLEAATNLADNTAKREWAVAELMKATKIPESIARFAVELAVQLVKAEAAKVK